MSKLYDIIYNANKISETHRIAISIPKTGVNLFTITYRFRADSNRFKIISKQPYNIKQMEFLDTQYDIIYEENILTDSETREVVHFLDVSQKDEDLLTQMYLMTYAKMKIILNSTPDDLNWETINNNHIYAISGSYSTKQWHRKLELSKEVIRIGNDMLYLSFLMGINNRYNFNIDHIAFFEEYYSNIRAKMQSSSVKTDSSKSIDNASLVEKVLPNTIIPKDILDASDDIENSSKNSSCFSLEEKTTNKVMNSSNNTKIESANSIEESLTLGWREKDIVLADGSLLHISATYSSGKTLTPEEEEEELFRSTINSYFFPYNYMLKIDNCGNLKVIRLNGKLKLLFSRQRFCIMSQEKIEKLMSDQDLKEMWLYHIYNDLFGIEDNQLPKNEFLSKYKFSDTMDAVNYLKADLDELCAFYDMKPRIRSLRIKAKDFNGRFAICRISDELAKMCIRTGIYSISELINTGLYPSQSVVIQKEAKTIKQWMQFAFDL